MSNPHNAVQPAPGREREFREVLDDFDVHCHDRVKLQAESIKADLPIRLADADAIKRYQASRSRGRPDAKDSEFLNFAGMHSFSEVYFNPSHTLSMVHMGIYCGLTCGNWRWVVLEKKDGLWRELRWVRVVTYS